MKLNPRKKYKDTYDGTVRTGAGWMRWFKEVVEDDHRDYGMTTTVGEYLELFTSNSGECDHHLIEV